MPWQPIDEEDEGSSPLTRGKQAKVGTVLQVVRLIPAHAGKTASPKHAPLSAEAHPRSRGENLRRSSDSAQENGSSPLTRGKQVSEEGGLNLGRLIPAHAGKTHA